MLRFFPFKRINRYTTFVIVLPEGIDKSSFLKFLILLLGTDRMLEIKQAPHGLSNPGAEFVVQETNLNLGLYPDSNSTTYSLDCLG